MPPLNSTFASMDPTPTVNARNVVAAVATTSDPEALSSEDLAKQKLFSTLVIACFFSFLFVIIGYVTYNHIKRNIDRLQQERKALHHDEEDEDKPIINRRTSVMGQGQKQVVIERRASVMSNSRRQSFLSMNGSNGIPCPQLNTKLLRQPSWINTPDGLMQNPPSGPPPPSMGSLNGKSSIPKNMATLNVPPTMTQSRCPNNFSYPNSYPMNTYLENVLIRYHGNSFTEEPCEKGTTEENESGVSSSESITDNDKDEAVGSVGDEEGLMTKNVRHTSIQEEEDEEDKEESDKETDNVFEKSESFPYIDEESRLLTT